MPLLAAYRGVGHSFLSLLHGDDCCSISCFCCCLFGLTSAVSVPLFILCFSVSMLASLGLLLSRAPLDAVSCPGDACECQPFFLCCGFGFLYASMLLLPLLLFLLLQVR